MAWVVGIPFGGLIVVLMSIPVVGPLLGFGPIGIGGALWRAVLPVSLFSGVAPGFGWLLVALGWLTLALFGVVFGAGRPSSTGH